MKKVIIIFLCNLLWVCLPAQDCNENAKKYLEILKSKPTPGFMFDRFYGAWMESSDTKALEEFLKKSTIDSPTSEWYLLLAFYYQKEGQTNLALNVFDTIDNKKLLTADVLYYQAKLESSALQFDDAIKHIDTAITLPIKENLKQNLLKLKAKLQYRNGDSTGAQETSNLLLAINENDKGAIEDVMEIQLNEGMYEDAKKYCQKLLNLTTDNYEKVNYQLKLATILKKLNELEGAEKIYIDLINLSGQDSWLLKEVIYQFESIYRSKDNITELMKKYDDIIKKNPQNVYLRKRYASLLSEQGDLENSIKEFHSIVELLPGDRLIKEEYASLLVSNGKNAEAITILESIATTKTGSKDFEIIFRIADLEFKSNNKIKAYQYIDLFLTKENLSEYEILRASKLIENNDENTKVIQYLEKTSLKQPTYIGLKESLINLYLLNKENEKALALTKSLNLKDDFDLNIRITNIFIKQKLFEDSIHILESLNQESKTSYKYNKILYDIYASLQNEEKKKELSKLILKNSNTYNEIRESLQLVRSLFNDNELEAYIKNIEEKKELEPKEILLLANLKYKANSLAHAFKIIESNLVRLSNNLLFLELAENFFSVAKEFDRALEVVDLLIKLSPKDSAKYLSLKTNLLRYAGKANEAIIIAKQLVLTTNNKAENILLLADLYQEIFEIDNGIDLLRKASFENPEEKSIKLKLTEFYQYTQNFKDTRRLLWSLIESTEDITEKVSYLDKLIKCYENDLGVDALIENLKERRLNNIKNTFPLLALIKLYQYQNDIENKSKYMIELSQLKSDDARLYIEIADVMIKDLNYEGAETILLKALSFDKTNIAKNKLIQFYFSIGKQEQAILELTRSLRGNLNEKEILGIAEKLIVANEYENAYQFLKKFIPEDKSYQYQYFLAIASKESKKEDTKSILYELLNYNVEFTQLTPNLQNNQNYTFDENLIPNIIKHISNFYQIIGAYNSYKVSPQNHYGHYGRYQGSYGHGGSVASIYLPQNLNELHNLSIAHLGDLYRQANKIQKEDILNQLKARNIEFAEIKLALDKNIFEIEKNIYEELSTKNPNDKLLKILSIIGDRNFYKQLDEKLLPLIKDADKVDIKLSYWLILIYTRYLPKLKLDFLEEAENVFEKINAPDLDKFIYFSTLFGNANDNELKMENEILNKVKISFTKLFDKNIEKILANKNNYDISSFVFCLYKFKDYERYTKLLNQQLANTKFYPSYNQYNWQYQRNNSNNLCSDLPFPGIIYDQLNNQFDNLYLKNKIIDEEFIKQILPNIENKYLKLAIYQNLEDYEEVEKIIKELELDKTFANLKIVAAYYGTKNKEKEAITALNKALMLSLTVDEKKALNGHISYYAKLSEEPNLKTEGLKAAKRLKNFNLSKEELLELAMILEELGDSSEADSLDKKINILSKRLKTNSKTIIPPPTFEKTFSDLIANGKKEEAFKSLIVYLKPNFTGITNQIKLNGNCNIEFHQILKILPLFEKNKLKDDLKKFMVENVSIEDDLMTSVFLMKNIQDNTATLELIKKLIDKKPTEIFYKILYYSFNINNKQVLDANFKKELNLNPVYSLQIINSLTYNLKNFMLNTYDFKDMYINLIENIKVNEDDEEKICGLILFTIARGGNIHKLTLDESVLSEDKNKVEDLLIQNYYPFFEEIMLKCIKNKVVPNHAACFYIQTCIENQAIISEDNLKLIIDALVEKVNSEKTSYDTINNTSNETELSFDILLAVYLLNQNKELLLDQISSKINGDQKNKFNKLMNLIKRFYKEDLITKEEIVILNNQSGIEGKSSLTTLLELINLIPVKNKNINEVIFKLIKAELDQKFELDYDIIKSLNKYFASQITILKNEDVIKFLLLIEKIMFPDSFDSALVGKKNLVFQSYINCLDQIFKISSYNEINLEVYKYILLASNQSNYYYYVARNIYTTLGLEMVKIQNILTSGLFNCSLENFQIVQYDRNKNFLIASIIEILKDQAEEANEILLTLDQNDGVKLLKIFMEEDNYQNVFEFLGSKIEIFKTMPSNKQEEWATYLTQYYPNNNTLLNESGATFKKFIADTISRKKLDLKNSFLKINSDERISHYSYSHKFSEVYPILLDDTNDNLMAIINATQKNYKFFARDQNDSSNDKYQRDKFIDSVLNIYDDSIKHLFVLTELLSTNKNWAPDYISKYSNRIQSIIKNHLIKYLENKSIKNNEEGKFVLPKELFPDFKKEFNYIINEVCAVNNNRVPFYSISLLTDYWPIKGMDDLFKEIAEDWSKEKEKPKLKNDIFIELKSIVLKDKKILDNYFISKIEDEAILPQIKPQYIQALLKNKNLNDEDIQKIFSQHVISLKSANTRNALSSSDLFTLITNYKYDILKKNQEELLKLIKNWRREFEIGESENNYSPIFKAYHFSNPENYISFIKLLKDNVDEKVFKNLFNSPLLGFKTYFPSYALMLKENLSDFILPVLSENIEALEINVENFNRYSFTMEELKNIEIFLAKMEDPELHQFFQLLFYRYGIKEKTEVENNQTIDSIKDTEISKNNELLLFKTNFKKFIKSPIKNMVIKKKLPQLLTNTDLIKDKEVQTFFQDITSELQLMDYQGKNFNEVKVLYYFYCKKFAKILKDNKLEEFKLEIKKEKDYIYNIQDQLINVLIESVMDNSMEINDLYENASLYFDVAKFLLELRNISRNSELVCLNHSITFMFLSGNGSEFKNYEETNKQKFRYFRNDILLNNAIEVFKKAYLQNESRSEAIIKSIDEFLKSDAKKYYEILPENEINSIFDFIKAEPERTKLLESLKLFNSKKNSMPNLYINNNWRNYD